MAYSSLPRGVGRSSMPSCRKLVDNASTSGVSSALELRLRLADTGDVFGCMGSGPRGSERSADCQLKLLQLLSFVGATPQSSKKQSSLPFASLTKASESTFRPAGSSPPLLNQISSKPQTLSTVEAAVDIITLQPRRMT